MSRPEISGSVINEFEEIVQSHINAHQQEQWGKILALALIGCFCYSEFNSVLISLALIAYGVKISLTKPDLTQDVSYDEIKLLSDDARAVFSRIANDTWNNEPVRLSHLNSIVRTTSAKHQAAAKAYRQAISNRHARQAQEHALYTKRDKTED